MAVQRPRAIVEFHVPNVGTASERVQQETNETLTALTVRVQRLEIDYNSHNEADECTVVCPYDDAGTDPRFLGNLEAYAYVDDVGYGSGELVPAIGNGDLRSGNLRFLGIAISVERVLSQSRKAIEVKIQDYTCLFLQHKSGFSPRYIPNYSDNLTTAWNKICDGTGYITFDTSPPSIVSTVSALKNRIVFEPPGLASLTLGYAVSGRVATLGAKFPIPTEDGADAWAVWQQIVGSLGLISFIRGSQCVVTTATDYYSGDDPPRMIWGLNVTEITETRDQQQVSAKNVGIFSFNPMTGQHLESFYPPKTDVTPKGRSKKKLGASALGPNVVLRAQDYEVFQCPMAISDQASLDAYAQRVWEERSRQEMTGKLKTPIIAVWTNSQFTGQGNGIPLTPPNWSLLGTQAGDRIRVEIDQGALTIIQAIPSLQGRCEALMVRGYSETMAQYIAKNLSAIASVSPEFQVHRVHVVLDLSDDAGDFEIEIEYVNRIEDSGSALPGVGARVPAIEGLPL